MRAKSGKHGSSGQIRFSFNSTPAELLWFLAGLTMLFLAVAKGAISADIKEWFVRLLAK